MDDLEFIQRCVNGDKKSWDEFVDRYSRLIYSYIHSVLRAKGLVFAQENINDLFQEIFFSLVKDNFNKLRTFKAKNGCSFATWLRQVVINASICYIRKIRPADASLDEDINDDFSLKDILKDNTLSVKDKISFDERLLSLKDCIQRLDTNDKYFLELHIYRGFSLEKIKSHLGVSRGTIDMRKSRIVEKLKECFKKKDFMLDL